MREIKFRAFSKKSKGMVLTEYATFLKDDELNIYDDYVVMQYTGLHDKNGVEIYEGDVVSNKIIKGNVRFTNGYFVVYDKNDDYILLSSCCVETIEVIGNVYENPELLETR